MRSWLHAARTPPSVLRSARRLPSWLLLMASVVGCQSGEVPAPAPAPTTSAAPAVAAPETSAAPELAAEAAEPKVVGASQIVVAWKGAELAPPTVTRSKEEARKRAEELLADVESGKSPFGELARSHSDDVSKAADGAMGNFERGAVPPALADAAFSLKIGETSKLIETPRGFHIVRRTR